MSGYPFARRLKILVFLACFFASIGSRADEAGEVTAIAAMNSQVAAFIGYSSGAVLYCARLSGCTRLDGTPASPVTAVDSPREGDSIRAWVGYGNGSVYFCTLTGGCTEQEMESPAQPGH
jgi:hypothetical protein